MAHAFDSWGWYVGEVPDGTPRSVAPWPLNASVSDAVGEPRANWTGHEWLTLPYVAPTPPPEPEPALPYEVETYKAHVVLILWGKMAAVKAYFLTIEDATVRELAETMFYRRPTIRRIGELTQQVQYGAGISDAERDAMFVQASAL